MSLEFVDLVLEVDFCLVLPMSTWVLGVLAAGCDGDDFEGVIIL